MCAKHFERRIEDFVCERCGTAVHGDGYTNHCSKCLWSKHVDVNPGDRAESCGGAMEPVGIEGSTGKYRILHRCVRCGMTRPVAVSKDDDMNAVLSIAGKN